MIFFITVFACPIIDCGEQDIGVCARIEEDQIVVNSKGCTESTFCELLDLNSWYENAGSYLYCQEFDEDDSSKEDVKCPTRDKNQFLMDDYHPKRCNSTDDCQMKNGNYTNCECGMDGYSYCMPEWGSEVYDLYWSFCDENNDKTTHEIWNYFDLIHEYYSYYVTAPDCAVNIFYELQDLQDVPSFSSKLSPLLMVIYMMQ